MILDIYNFYLGTPMARPDYMRLPLKLIPHEIFDNYKLNYISENEWVYLKIVKVMYGLPQSGKLAHNLLKKLLSKDGYLPVQITSGLWRHVWRPVTFTLVVDDFGIKFTGNTHANHLIHTLKKDYEITTDPQGQIFVGIKLKWDYERGTFYTHVPNYVTASLNKYQNPTPSRPQHAPAKPTPIQYGSKIQTEYKDKSPRLSTVRVKRIQDVVGTFS